MGKKFALFLCAFGLLLSLIPLSVVGLDQERVAAVREVSPFSYCCIPHQGPFTDIETVIPQLMQAMQVQNIFPRGPMLGLYYNDPNEVSPGELQWEIGFPVMDQAVAQSPLVKKAWTHTTVATAFHIGPYENTGETILKVMEWVTAQGYTQVGPVLERYLDMNPDQVAPEKLRTEIWIPISK